MAAEREMTNKLHYGDNLAILRRYIPDESVSSQRILFLPFAT